MKRRSEKFSILCNYWNKVHTGLMNLGSKKKNIQMLAFANSVARISREVKEYLLKKYCERCNEKHTLAFFQWRLKYRSNVCHKEALEECLYKVQTLILGRIDISKTVSPTTAIEGGMSPALEKALGISKPQIKPWLVNSFWNIGWPDPFPDEHSSMDREFLVDRTALVYEEARYHEEYSPSAVWIPSKLVLIKLMRACIGVDKPENLWIV